MYEGHKKGLFITSVQGQLFALAIGVYVIYLGLQMLDFHEGYESFERLIEVKEDYYTSANTSFQVISQNMGIAKDDLISYYVIRYPYDNIPEYTYYASDWQTLREKGEVSKYVDFLFETVFAFDSKICAEEYRHHWSTNCEVSTLNNNDFTRLYPEGSIVSKVSIVKSIIDDLSVIDNFDITAHLENDSTLDESIRKRLLNIIYLEGIVVSDSNYITSNSIGEVVVSAYTNAVIGGQSQYKFIRTMFDKDEDVLEFLDKGFEDIYGEKNKFEEAIVLSESSGEIDPLPDNLKYVPNPTRPRILSGKVIKDPEVDVEVNQSNLTNEEY